MFIERTSVGLDVHARSVAAVAVDCVTGATRRARLGADPAGIRAWLTGLDGPVAVAYEAGPTGFGLARVLRQEGIRTVVAAPSKIARPSGDRVKNDFKDALLLSQLLQVGQLVAVQVPSIEREAARDLFRSYDAARRDLMRARHRTSKLLLRHGIVYDGGNAWTGAHDRWLRSIRLELPGARAAFDDYYESVTFTTARQQRLAAQVETMALACADTALTRRLCCLRGIGLLTGFGLAVEIDDWTRFDGASIGAYVGLTPSEHSSGTKRSLGAITKAGNGHVRRLLTEAAWHHRQPYRPSQVMRARWEAAPRDARLRGHAGNRRLHERWVQFNLRHKEANIANTAIARELAGWCWSLAVLPDSPTDPR